LLQATSRCIPSGFLSYSKLCEKLEAAQEFLGHLKPDFIDDIAEFYDPSEEFDA